MAELRTESSINHEVHAPYLTENSECLLSTLCSQQIDASLEVMGLSDAQPASESELEVGQLGYWSLKDTFSGIRCWSTLIHANRKRFLSDLIRNNREHYQRICEALLLEYLIAKEYFKYIKKENVHTEDYAIQNMINHWIHATNHWVNFECRIWKPWNDLPCDMIEEVAKRIGSPKNYLNFAAACKSWNFFAKEIISCYPYKLSMDLILPLKRHTLPMLLHTSRDDTKLPCLYNIVNHETSNMPCVGLELRKMWIATTWKGWLVITDYKLTTQSKITLLNPLTNSQIALQICSKFIFDPSNRVAFPCINRVLVASLDSTTNPENCLIFAKVGYTVVHSCRIGDNKWKMIHDLYHVDDMVTCENKGLLYAVKSDGSLLVIKMYPDGDMNVTFVVETRIDASKHYIVESLSGELLLISRLTDHKKHYALKKNHWFQGSQVTHDVAVGTWKEMETLQGQTLFVGYNGVLCFNSSLYPEIKRNCIYFSHDYGESVYHLSDIGVYHMDDKSIIYFTKTMNHFSLQTAAVWFSPAL